jgi:alanine dehydrogenase
MATVHLREQDFRDRFTVRDFIDACRQAFELYGAGDIVNPPRQEIVEERDGTSYFRLDMPATWPGRYRARKIIEEVSHVGSGRLGGREAWIELEDLRAGTRVRLDAGHITDMRTGAAGALGIEYLTRHDVRRIGILGTGRIARCLALCCDDLFDLEELRCTSRTAGRRDAFATVVAPRLRCTRLTMTPTIDACLDGVDAMLTAVPTPEPILSRVHLAHVDAIAVIAGDKRTRQLHPDVLETRPVIVDILEQAEKSGEFRYAEDQGARDRIALARTGDGRVLTMGDAACGRAPQVGTAYLTGMAAQDLCAAAMIYERLLESL